MTALGTFAGLQRTKQPRPSLFKGGARSIESAISSPGIHRGIYKSLAFYPVPCYT